MVFLEGVVEAAGEVAGRLVAVAAGRQVVAVVVDSSRVVSARAVRTEHPSRSFVPLSGRIYRQSWRLSSRLRIP